MVKNPIYIPCALPEHTELHYHKARTAASIAREPVLRATMDNLPGIAIVGIAAELPAGKHGASNLDFNSYWPFLVDGHEAYEPIPKERFNTEGRIGTGPGQLVTATGAFLKDVDQFDPVEFGISAKDASGLSLGTRKLIELSFLALLDSGIDSRSANVGCYASAVNHGTHALSDVDECETFPPFCELPSMVANRISYYLDLRGPSVPVDTACSSTLTALHLAAQAIAAGECDAALVAGCQLNHRYVDWLDYSHGGVLAPDGKCKPFDVSANGFARGEGAVVVVLKRADAAVRDHDHIYATILGSAINSTGQQAPLYAPVGHSQEEAMLSAFARAKRSPIDVDYMELHATGTAVGDPTEANWVGNRFHKSKGRLLCGSVKGNLGHLEITAYLASLLKVIHVLNNRVVPPTVNLSTLNPRITWDPTAFHIPTGSALAIDSQKSKLLACLSSSGIGGSNGHTVVEGPAASTTPTEAEANPAERALLFVAGGLTPRAASAAASELRAYLESQPASLWPAISTKLGRRARQLTWKTTATAIAGDVSSLRFKEPTLSGSRRPVVFVFSGQGPQHIDMGRELFAAYPTFKKSVLEMDDIYKERTGKSLITDFGLYGPRTDSAASLATEWEVVLPAMTILQMATHDLLVSLGLQPDAVLGHSAGETAVLYASGAGERALAIDLALARSKFMAVAETLGGGMAAVSCNPEDAKTLIADTLAEIGGDTSALSLCLVCYNAPNAVAISGHVAAVEALCAKAESRGVWARKLRIPVPVHSPMIDPIRAEFEALFQPPFGDRRDVFPKTTTISSVTGEVLESAFDADYYWSNAREAVQFVKTIETASRLYPNAVFVEIAPHPVLASYISSTAPASTRVVSMLRRPGRGQARAEQAAFIAALGKLTEAGLNPDFNALNDVENDSVPGLQLPAYPFTKKPVPFHAQHPSYNRQQEPVGLALNRPLLRLSAQTHPLLGEHVVHGIPIMPGAGFIEMAFEYGARALQDVEFLSALSLASDPPEYVQMTLEGSEWSIRTSSSPPALSSGQPIHFDRLHARGYLTKEAADQVAAPLDVEAIKSRCPTTRKISDLYDFGFKGYADYGPEFRRIESCVSGGNELLLSLRGRDDSPQFKEFVFSPAVLDSIFQACMFFELDRNEKILDYETRDFHLPARVSSVTIQDDYVTLGMPEVMFAHLSLKLWSPDDIIVDINIMDTSGRSLLVLDEFTMRRHASVSAPVVDRRFTIQWQPADIKAMAVCVEPRALEKDNSALFAALDYAAQVATRKTLENPVDVGESDDRHRYFAFVQRLSSAEIAEVDTKPFEEASAPYFELTRRVAMVQKDILKSSTAAVQALFAETDTMTNFYSSEASFDGSCKDAARVFSFVLGELERQGKRAVKVMEVGCGTGMLTVHLARALEKFPSLAVEYTASDLSLELARQAEKRAANPAVRPRRYNLAADLPSQGMSPGSLDVITALHVLHAVPKLQEALARLVEILVPGGILVIVDFDGKAWEEGRPSTMWYDFVFGSFAEWFGFQDGRTHCSVNPDVWRQMLLDVGCSDVQFVPSPVEEDYSMVIIAQKAPVSHETKPTIEAAPADHDVVFNYKRGNENDLRVLIKSRDIASSATLWIFCVDAEDFGVVQGLSRTLRQELPQWRVHLVAIDQTLTQDDILRRLLALPSVEPEIRVDANGDIWVPRVVEAVEGPAAEVTLTADHAWVLLGDAAVKTDVGLPIGQAVVVAVDQWSSEPATASVRAFVGRVVDAGSTSLVSGSRVAGLTTSPLCNLLAVDSRSLSLITGEDVKLNPDTFFALTAATLALPTSVLINPAQAAALSAIVLDSDVGIGANIVRTYEHLGARVRQVTSDEKTSPSRLRSAVATQIVVGSASTLARYPWLATLLSASGKIFAWDDPQHGIPHLLDRDPSTVGSALMWALEWTKDYPGFAPQEPAVTPKSLISPWIGKSVPDQSTLLDPRKVYLLVGGTGGLGIHLAAWMYRKGARNVVLTSRSGMGAISRNVANNRMLTYLQTLSDLSLSVEAVDATDSAAMAALVAKQEKPIGGCVLMTLQLVDKLFMNQTDDDFNPVVANKLESWKILESVLDLSKLDFIVGYSSISGLGGIPGQSNYTSACTAMEYQITKHRNAFSLVVPAITDCGWLARDQTSHQSESLLSWGIKSEALFAGMEDGLRILAARPLDVYIPAIDWRGAAADIGSPPVYAHLTSAPAPEAPALEAGEADNALEAIVLGMLDVDAKDFSPKVPLTSYGLDSLVAVRLAGAVKAQTGTTVTQLQLLANMTFEGLVEKVEGAKENAA